MMGTIYIFCRRRLFFSKWMNRNSLSGNVNGGTRFFGVFKFARFFCRFLVFLRSLVFWRFIGIFGVFWCFIGDFLVLLVIFWCVFGVFNGVKI